MEKRLLFQLILCGIISIANTTKDILPTSKIYLKKHICQFNIDSLVKKKNLFDFELEMTDDVINNIIDLKKNYCNKLKNNQLKKQQ